MAEDARRADGRTGRRRAAALLVPAQAVALLIAIPLLFWGADALARLGAETLVARNLGVATGVIEPPDIEVRGRLFLPQVIRGSYEHVDVEIRGVTSRPLRVDRVDARLRGVRLPFHDVLVRDLGELGVVDSSTRVRLTYADLNSYFDQTGRPLQCRCKTTDSSALRARWTSWAAESTALRLPPSRRRTGRCESRPPPSTPATPPSAAPAGSCFSNGSPSPSRSAACRSAKKSPPSPQPKTLSSSTPSATESWSAPELEMETRWPNRAGNVRGTHSHLPGSSR